MAKATGPRKRYTNKEINNFIHDQVSRMDYTAADRALNGRQSKTMKLYSPIFETAVPGKFTSSGEWYTKKEVNSCALNPFAWIVKEVDIVD